ncbi:O-antigen ligase family protein [Microbacterium sp. 179-I 1D1 NHS]|uniref:O-antigen ligase family protein n=1 Tax=unclassified Microbacterium TaxID=2609290 RepID=UPI0038797ADF
MRGSSEAPLASRFLRQIATATWSVVALGIPLYRILPPEMARAWSGLIALLIVATILLGLGQRPKWWGIWAFAGYASIVAGITSSGASGPAATLSIGAQLLLILGMAPFAIRGTIARAPEALRVATVTFLIAQTVSSSAGVMQILGVSTLDQVQANGRSPGLAGHPNVLGLMSTIAIIVCIAIVLRRGRKSFLAWIALAANTLGLVSTGSLSSMLPCLIAVAVLLLANGIGPTRLLVTAGLSAAAVTFAISLPPISDAMRDPLSRILQVTGQTNEISTLEIRRQTYDSAWEYIQIDPLLGKGLDVESAAAIDLGTVVHSLPLRAWYQGGIVLAAAVAALVVASFVLVVRALVRKQDATATAVIVMIILYSLTSALFEQAYYWLPLLAAWGTLRRSSPRPVPDVSTAST